MLNSFDINIRDPYVLYEEGKYYLYGTRAKDFGTGVGGFDVYISSDLKNWSEATQCFSSDEYGLNTAVNWAPEVHRYRGEYYMLATFTKENGLRGTYILKAQSPTGPFVPHSDGAVTPYEWECLDGTLYTENGIPYLVFCHEHTQITDGTVCYLQLSEDLKTAVSEPVTLFAGSEPYYIEKKPEGEHYITDGPFMYRTDSGELLMLWSTFINHRYAECLVKFSGGSIKNDFVHLAPLIDNDGGHGMIFRAESKLFLTFHKPNKTGFEHPHFLLLNDTGNGIELKNTERVLQFGQGNFLRAFADDFIDSMNSQGLFDGSVVIVKPTPRGNLDAFNEQNSRYHLVIRGIENGKAVQRIREIECVSRCINPYEEYEDYIGLANNPELRFIISNTTEAGITFDESCKLTDRPALSFPAKLTQLLYARFKAGLDGFVLLPCELIDSNGDELKKCVLKHAELWALGEDFTEWVNNKNTFCNTLVDRIVTGYPKGEVIKGCENDRLLDTGEPYHLWAIEGDFENELPLKKAGFNVIWTKDIKPVKARKVRLLNGAHTVTVFPALLTGVQTVGECLEDEDISGFLKSYLYDCALPMLEQSEDNREFADAVLERFSNPYIKHMLTSIALNSVSKFSVRVTPTALDFMNRYGKFPRSVCVSLAGLIYYYRHCQPNDDASLISEIKEKSLEQIISGKMFGADYSDAKDDILKAYKMFENGEGREALKWAVL